MIEVRVTCTTDLSDAVEQTFLASPGVTSLAKYAGASVLPVGDVFEAQVERDSVNALVYALEDLGVQVDGSIEIDEDLTDISDRQTRAEEQAHFHAGVIWPEVIAKITEQSRLSFIFIAFMVLATMIAAIAVITDSTILVIAAMVLGPEFNAVIALGLALVLRKRRLFGQAVKSLIIGFVVAIAVTSVMVWVAQITGLVTSADLDAPRPSVSFIYTPSVWSFIVAIIAATAGVLAITSSVSTGIIGVFISVTTIPAAGNIAIGLVFARWAEVTGSALQLSVNLAGMALAGWITLKVRVILSKRLGARGLSTAVRRQSSAPDGSPAPGSSPQP
jgi:uncharacterized hydrophobic protein (TIGR00271 family)